MGLIKDIIGVAAPFVPGPAGTIMSGFGGTKRRKKKRGFPGADDTGSDDSDSDDAGPVKRANGKRSSGKSRG
jgi:hypothetical protein